jgi:hypothetical protein
MAKGWPATVMDAERGVAPGFSATANTTSPAPPPEVDEAAEIHAGREPVMDQVQPVAATTDADTELAVKGKVALGERSVKLQSMPDCVTMMLCPATVSEPLRAATPGLAVTVKLSRESPVPDDAAGVSHAGALVVATQPQDVPLAAISIDPVPPPEGCSGLIELRVKLHGTPACVTVKGWSATMTLAERACVLELATTFSCTVPAPEPEPPEENVTQLEDEAAVQLQPAGAETLNVVAPPTEDMELNPGVNE